MDTRPLCPAPAELRLDRLVVSPEAITVVVRARPPSARCPLCGHSTSRVHARYTRCLADLPWHGLRVRFEVHVRKFRCALPGCRRRIFCERLPATTVPYGRRTCRAEAALAAIGFALGGRPGAHLAQGLGLAIGATALLARLRGAPAPEIPTPRVLGVDDWAWRRGQRYGTVLVDLERHRVIDLLPDREAATLAAWLRAHPGVELLSRDRAGAYAEAARQGAPAAIQIADRFHLVCNLTAALDRVCQRHAPAIRTALAAVASPPPLTVAETRRRRYSGLPANRPGPTRAEQQGAERRARRVARYEAVVALRAHGRSLAAIAREVDLDRRTVSTWLAAVQFPERKPRPPPVRTATEPFAAEIAARYAAGQDNAAAMARGLRPLGYTGSDQGVRRRLAWLRRTQPRGASPELAVVRRAAFTPRQLVWWLRTPDVELEGDAREAVTAVCTTLPGVAEARRLVLAFGALLTARDGAGLDPWLVAAEQSDLHAFAVGVRRDHDAVLAAIIFPWSQGQVEGQVQRLKLLKRAMYGRAGFPLLRARVLHAA